MGKDALFISWGSDDRTRMWLEAWRLSQHDWNIDVLAEPLETVRPELFPGLHILCGPVKRYRVINKNSLPTGGNRDLPSLCMGHKVKM
jgi:hypothetical protein